MAQRTRIFCNYDELIIVLEKQRMSFRRFFKIKYYINHGEGGETMIGAIIFVIVFVLFVLIGLAGISLPIGDWLIKEYIPDLLDPAVEPLYAQLAEGIINGVIYGIIIWFAFSIAMMIYEKMRGPKEVVVKVENKG